MSMDVASSRFAIGCEPRIGRSVSIDNAASLLRVSRRTIYSRISEGRLATIRTLGGSQRVLIDSLQAYVLDGGHSPDRPKPPARPVKVDRPTEGPQRNVADGGVTPW